MPWLFFIKGEIIKRAPCKSGPAVAPSDGTRQIPDVEILCSRLTIPALTSCIERKRLFSLMDDICNHKLTLVTAGAGYGKTTFVAQSCRRLDRDTLWYRMEDYDVDFLTFTHHIIAGFTPFVPDLGERLYGPDSGIRFETNGRNHIPASEYRLILTRLANELNRRITDHMVIVLDDFHWVAQSRDINQALPFLIENLNPNFHLVIVSRVRPSFSLSRYRAARCMLDISQEDLVFSAPEIMDMSSRVFGVALSAENAWELLGKTEGWVTGIILFYHSSKRKKHREIEELLHELKGGHRVISDYLGENVFHLQPHGIQEFLLATSILPRIDADAANHLLETHKAHSILEHLEKEHLFISRIQEKQQPCYFYHHLFQSFLKKKLILKHGMNHVRHLHHKAAHFYAIRHRAKEALEQFIASGNETGINRLLPQVGLKLIQNNQIDYLDSLLTKLPEPFFRINPWSNYFKGSVFLSLSDLPKAIHYTETARRMFCAMNAPDGELLCLIHLGESFYWTGDWAGTQAIFKKLLGQPGLTAGQRVKLLGYMAICTSWLGDIGSAEQHSAEAFSALAKAVELPEREKRILEIWCILCRSHCACIAGDIRRGLESCSHVKDPLKQFDDIPLLMHFYLSMSFYFLWLGEFANAEEYLGHWHTLQKDRQFPDYKQDWYFIVRGVLDVFSKGRDRSIPQLERGLALCRKCGNKWGEGLILCTFGVLHAMEDEYDAAFRYVSEALDLFKIISNPWIEGRCHAVRAVCFMGLESWAMAERAIETAKTLTSFSKYETCANAFIEAGIYHSQGKQAKAFKHIAFALSTMKKQGYGKWIVTSYRWLPGLLVEAYDQGIEPEFILEFFNETREQTHHILIQYQTHDKPSVRKKTLKVLTDLRASFIEPLHISCLGRFRVFVGERELPEIVWKNKKAKFLLQILILERDKGYISKDRLMEMLWPEEHPEKASNRLFVTMTALRKILEPDLPRGLRSSYLLRINDTYRLGTGEKGSIDFRLFLKEVERAGREKDLASALARCLKARRLYAGELFEEDPYEEWFVDKRERLRFLYLTLLRKIITLHDRKGDYEKCIEHTKTYIETEPYEESMYRLLMDYYFKTGQTQMAVKTYDTCRQNICEKMDCPLSPETGELYKRLVSL